MTMITKACFAFARMALAEELVVFCDTCKEFLAYYNMRYGFESMNGYSKKMICDRFYTYLASGIIEK